MPHLTLILSALSLIAAYALGRWHGRTVITDVSITRLSEEEWMRLFESLVEFENAEPWQNN